MFLFIVFIGIVFLPDIFDLLYDVGKNRKVTANITTKSP